MLFNGIINNINRIFIGAIANFVNIIYELYLINKLLSIQLIMYHIDYIALATYSNILARFFAIRQI